MHEDIDFALQMFYSTMFMPGNGHVCGESDIARRIAVRHCPDGCFHVLLDFVRSCVIARKASNPKQVINMSNVNGKSGNRVAGTKFSATTFCLCNGASVMKYVKHMYTMLLGSSPVSIHTLRDCKRKTTELTGGARYER